MLSRLWRKKSSGESPWVFLHASATGAEEERIFAALREHFPARRTQSRPVAAADLAQLGQLAGYDLLRTSLPLYRLQQHLPHARFLLYLRDPVSRVAQEYLAIPEPRPDFAAWLADGAEDEFYSLCLGSPESAGLPLLGLRNQMLHNFPGHLLVHPEFEMGCQLLRRIFPGLSIASVDGPMHEPADLLERSLREQVLARNPLDRDLHSQALKSVELPDRRQRLRLTAGIDLQASGCHGLEVYRDGRSFHWTGAESESVIELPVRLLPHSEVKLALETVVSLDPAILDTLQVSLGGLPITRLASSSRDRLVWRGQAFLQQPLASVGTTVPLRIISPMARPFGADKRCLGLSLHQVSLEFSGELSTVSEGQPALPIGALLAALQRSRPDQTSLAEKLHQQALETVLDALWENQRRQDFQVQNLSEQMLRLRTEWEDFVARHLEHRSTQYVLASFQERLTNLEEMLDAYSEE